MSGLSRSDKKISKLGSPVISRREVIEEEAEELQDVETAASRNEVGKCIANINSLNHALGNLSCSVCEDSGCVQFTEEPKKKHGFSLSLQLQCTSCHSVFSDNLTSPRAGAEHVHQPFEVNDRFFYFFIFLNIFLRGWFGSCGPEQILCCVWHQAYEQGCISKEKKKRTKKEQDH